MNTPLPDLRRDAAECPVREALAALSGVWAVGVVGRLARGAARFGQLRAGLARPVAAGLFGPAVGVSAKVLADELRRLAAAGVVERVNRGAAGVAYRLTSRGRALVPLLDVVAEWAAGPELERTSGAGRPAATSPAPERRRLAARVS